MVTFSIGFQGCIFLESVAPIFVFLQRRNLGLNWNVPGAYACIRTYVRATHMHTHITRVRTHVRTVNTHLNIVHAYALCSYACVRTCLHRILYIFFQKLRKKIKRMFPSFDFFVQYNKCGQACICFICVTLQLCTASKLKEEEERISLFQQQRIKKSYHKLNHRH